MTIVTPIWSKVTLAVGLLPVLMQVGCAGEDSQLQVAGFMGISAAGSGGITSSATAVGGAVATGGSAQTTVATGGAVAKAGAGGAVAKAGKGGTGKAGAGGSTTDACPDDPKKTAPGKCGCGVADTDTDKDGTPDCKEQTQTPVDGCEVGPIPDNIRSSFDIDPFYQKYASANGVIVATGPKVGDEAILKNCQLLLEMFSNDKIRQSIISDKMFFTMIAESEQLSSLPEIGNVYGTMYDVRARGLGSMIPTICAEDSILCMPSDKWRGDCICPHEYGHTLADWGLKNGDSALASRWASVTESIRSSGRLSGAYIWQDGSTSGMMAWGVQAWYNCAVDGTNGGYHSDINTRAEVKKELPELYEILSEILPEDNQYKDCYYKP